MEATWFLVMLVHITLSVIGEGTLTKGDDLYVSRAFGDDSWSCDQSKPCKTIWRAVSLASRGDHIHLDGTNTDKDPYTCQSGTSHHPGMYVNTSLSLVGFGPMPQIQCAEGNTMLFDGSGGETHMNVTLAGLFFNGTSVSFKDSLVEIDSCRFEGSKDGIDLMMSNKNYLNIQIKNSIFVRNINCISVIVNNTTDTEQCLRVLFVLRNTSFRENSAAMSKNAKLVSITELHRTQSVCSDITLDNVTFSDNQFGQAGLVNINFKNGLQNLYLQYVVFTGNIPWCNGFDCSENVVHSHSIYVLMRTTNCAGLKARAFNISATNLTVEVRNSSFSGYSAYGDGGVFLLSGIDLCKLEVLNSSFFNTSASSKGGAVLASAAQALVDFKKCVFRHNTAVGGGAIHVDTSTSLSRFVENTSNDEETCSDVYEFSNGILDINITECEFRVINSYSGGGGAVSVNSPQMSVRLRDSKFFNSSSLGPGGALLVGLLSGRSESVSLFIENSHFMRCRSDREVGGAVKVTFGRRAQVRLYNSKFMSNYALGYGGAVAVSGLEDKSRNSNNQKSSFQDANLINIENSEFKDNSGSSQGGAICFIYSIPSVNPKRDLTVKNSTFINNFAAGPGGALAALAFKNLCMTNNSSSEVKDCSNVTIDSSYFVSNRAFAPGGAIDYENLFTGVVLEHNITIKNSHFVNNSASAPGGAITVPKSIRSLSFENVTMESNVAVEGFGGAVATDNDVDHIPTDFSVKISHSRFLKNRAEGPGGALFYVGVNLKMFEVLDSLFEDNHALRGTGGALYLQAVKGSPDAFYFISNATFKNCTSGSLGGALHLASVANLNLLVRSCLFTDNSSPASPGGAVCLEMPQDTLSDPGCITKNLVASSINGEPNKFREWNYNSSSIFQDTTFRRNTALLAGAVYLSKGNTTFRNCSFVNNFAVAEGGHIYTEEGSTSVNIHDSRLLQTKSDINRDSITFSKTSFIYTRGAGPLIVRNTTIESMPYGDVHPLVMVSRGGLVDFGDNNLTVLCCPIGSQLQVDNFTNDVTTQIHDASCKVRVTVLQFSCMTCAGGLYSLQRGHAFGTRIVPGFHCLSCPFGANCSQNIVAQPNFWGFKERDNPPSLKFIICPLGYCTSPDSTTSLGYNGCQGNRIGELCGHCKPGYTETIYSTHCRASERCKDYWFWPVALLYVSLMAFYLTFKPPVLPWLKRQIWWFNEPRPVNQEPDFDSGYLKISFYFFQTANLLLVSTSSQSPIKTYFVEPVLGLFSFQQKISDGGLICPFNGLTVVYKQLFSLSYVFGTLLMICVFCAIHCGFRKLRGQHAPLLSPYLCGLLQTLLLGYMSLGSVSFNLLRCVSIGSERRLFYDGSVVCFQWWQYGLIAFIVTFIVPFVFVLFWGSLKLFWGNLSVGKFLVACAIPLPLLAYWTFTSLIGNPANVDSATSQDLRESVGKVLYDPFKRPQNGSKGSLSWESVLIGRRLALIVLHAFVSDPLSRLLVMTFFCVSSLLHHVMTQPFRSAKANLVETVSLLSLTVLAIVNMFSASFLSLAVPSSGPYADWLIVCQWVELVILGFAPAVFGFLVVVSLISQFCRLIFMAYLSLCCVRRICCPHSCSDFPKEGTERLSPVA